MRNQLATCLAALAVATLAADARAVNSYEFSLSFSEALMEAEGTPDEAIVKHYEGWDSAVARIRKRNMPFIEITNTSTAAEVMSRFTMSIAKPQYDFSDDVLLSFAKLGVTTPGINISSSSPDDGDTLLVVDFVDGLQPNETVRFQVDIDVDPDYLAANPGVEIYPHPDYRMVFFDVNGNDSSDNSVLTTTFTAANGSTSSQSQTLPDFDQTTDVYINGTGLRNYNTMDGVEMFELTGEGEIPEPAAGFLAMMALAAVRYRRR
ncbi:hypothetical protein Pla123a_05010 [Posidoniimonas polymericola]|uniref:PEP-CTERM protein-sorting domain-containing protein n=1 Tax=Posidoniimonas polymericola TaxID=2528002 RepID=A0A5C5ZEB1_9BACT|nr:hypothetical protein [Posidoniimonas polymericola]TWT85694.1 hypothetical protein Pla123a_05010 [Posidoniimonas polymericola]